MKLNWNTAVSALVRARLEALPGSEQEGTDNQRRAARATEALPVYSGWTGDLCLTTEGAVLFHDYESEQVGPETDDRWIIAAALSAVEKYPELRVILPQRPSTAATCAICSGTGRLLDTSVHCGTCFGLGWVS
jgi:hypothetical protein